LDLQKFSAIGNSKSFTRNLVKKYNIPGNPQFKVFNAIDGVEAFLSQLEGIVIKPDGLTGGKGVLVQGDHFSTKEEALNLCKQILTESSSLIVEEKFDGEEFSLQYLCDGKTVVGTPLVQDHKRRFEGDKGPTPAEWVIFPARSFPAFFKTKGFGGRIGDHRQVAAALLKETGSPYKGIMYGGFIATKDGAKLLEYNARFGDPEAMNILPLLKQICGNMPPHYRRNTK